MRSIDISTNKTFYYYFFLSQKKKKKNVRVLIPLENYISKKTRNTDKGHYSYMLSKKFFIFCNFVFI